MRGPCCASGSVADMPALDRETAGRKKAHGQCAGRTDAETPAEEPPTERLESGFSIGLLTAEYRAPAGPAFCAYGAADSWSREAQALEARHPF